MTQRVDLHPKTTIINKKSLQFGVINDGNKRGTINHLIFEGIKINNRAVRRLQTMFQRTAKDDPESELTEDSSKEDPLASSEVTILTLRNCELLQQAIIFEFVEVLRSNAPQISSVNLERSFFTPKAFEEFTQGLTRSFVDLDSINFDKMALTGPNCKKALEAFKSAKIGLKQIRVAGNPIANEGHRNIVDLARSFASLKSLSLDNLQLKEDFVECLAKLLKSAAQLEELRLNFEESDKKETKLDLFKIYKMTDSKTLQLLEISGVQIDNKTCEYLGGFVSTQLHSLYLPDCHLGDSNIETFLGAITVGNIQHLDLSSNSVTAAQNKQLSKMVASNKTLVSLNLSDNKLAGDDFDTLVGQIIEHPTLKILNLSQNELGNQGFKTLFQPISANKGSLQELILQTNKIGGPQIDTLFLSSSFSLKILDLQQNELTVQNCKQIICYTQYNPHIETVLVDEQLTHSNLEEYRLQICLQCSLNTQISTFLLKSMSKSSDNHLSANFFYRKYKIKELCLQRGMYQSGDFILKFVQQNAPDIKKFFLKRISLLSFTAPIIVKAQQHSFKYLTELRFERVKIDRPLLRHFVKELGSMRCLEILTLNRVTDLNCLETQLAASLVKLQKLKKVTMRRNFFKKFDFVREMMAMCTDLSDVDIYRNKLDGPELIKIWDGFHENIHVCHFLFSRFSCIFEFQTQHALEMELQFNQKIKEMGLREILKQTKNPKDTLRYRHRDITSIEAVNKFLIVKRSVRYLDLTGCNLTKTMVNKFCMEVIKNELQFVSLTLDDNPQITDSNSKGIYSVIKRQKCLQTLSLQHTGITEKGLTFIFRGTIDCLKLKTILLKGCKMNFSDENKKVWSQFIQQLRKNLWVTNIEVDASLTATSDEFRDAFVEELNKNKLILQEIVPIMIKQEEKARQEEIERKRKQKSDYLKNLKEEGANKDDEQEQILKLTGPLKEVKLLRKSPKKQRRNSGLNRQSTRNLDFLDLPALPRESEQNSPDEPIIQINAVSQLMADQKDKDETEKDSDSEDDKDDSTKKEQTTNFNITLGNKKFENLAFLTKFMQEFKQIGGVDIGSNQLRDDEQRAFSKAVQANTNITSMKGSKMNLALKKKMEAELEKNKAIVEVQQNDDVNFDFEGEELKLEGKNLENIGFLNKVASGMSNLQTINLSNNNLGPKGAYQVADMLASAKSVKSLILNGCQLRVSGLTVVCQSLFLGDNPDLNRLEIRNNSIEDSFLKILLTLLFKCEKLQHIEYDLYKEKNIENLEKFKQAVKKLEKEKKKGQVQEHNILEILENEDDEHHHDIKLWEKIIFPIYLWKTFLHAKHDAFRFKYDTDVTKRIETQIAAQIRYNLYGQTIFYYGTMFIAPFFFITQKQDGYSYWLYFIFAIQALYSAVYEVISVLRIQKLVNDPKILTFNRWHVVELFMGQTARLDAFLDFIILILFLAKWEYFAYFAFPSLFFVIVNLIFPITMLIKLATVDKKSSPQPLMEATNNLAFIRENMLLATVLDSFCLNNSIPVASKQVVFGKLMGGLSFFLQDAPQFTIHLLFKIIILNKYQKLLSKKKMLLFSMLVSFFAVLISLFNLIMFKANEFDPLLLEQDLYNRRWKNRALAEIEEQKHNQEKKAMHKSMLTGIMMGKLGGGAFGANDESKKPKFSLVERIKRQKSLREGQVAPENHLGNALQQIEEIQKQQTKKQEDSEVWTDRNLLSGRDSAFSAKDSQLTQQEKQDEQQKQNPSLSKKNTFFGVVPVVAGKIGVSRNQGSRLSQADTRKDTLEDFKNN